MTAYFDEVSSEISSDLNTVDDIIGIEQRVISHALLVCGDREFPDDLREEIMTIIAVNGIFPYVSHSYRERESMAILVNEIEIDGVTHVTPNRIQLLSPRDRPTGIIRIGI